MQSRCFGSVSYEVLVRREGLYSTVAAGLVLNVILCSSQRATHGMVG
jgi:hypothetical protein